MSNRAVYTVAVGMVVLGAVVMTLGLDARLHVGWLTFPGAILIAFAVVIGGRRYLR